MRISAPRLRIDYPRSRHTGLRRFMPSWRQCLSIVGIVFLLGVVGVSVVYARTEVPQANAVSTAQSTIVYWDDGKTEMTRFGENRTAVTLADVPVSLRNAVLAAEDRDFYSHGGFSPTGIGRAAWNDLNGGATQGGSTITQQYAKNAYLTQDQTIKRKVKELFLAVKLDRTRSKDQIFEDYLNTIYFGRGAYGVEAASEAYFGKPVSELSVEQGAVIASILRSPGFYDPANEAGRERLENRFNYVLNGMVEEGWLPAAERAGMTFPTIKKAKAASKVSGPTGYLVEMVRAELAKDGFDKERLDRGGLRIVSTFNKKQQEDAVAAVKDAGPKTQNKGLRTGLVSMNPTTGAVVAVYGGTNVVKQYNAVTFAEVQAGSTFKPFGLVAALDDGMSLNSTFDGTSPQRFKLADGSDYPTLDQPKIRNDSDGEAFGPITLTKATEDSINTAYVGMNIAMGPKKTKQAAVKLGIPADTQGLGNSPINILGVSSPHIIDMATAYATIANNGLRTERHVISKITNSNGGLLYEARAVPKRVFPDSVMRDTTYALQHVVEFGTGTAARALGRPAAGKTGTTTDYKSAWFVGYTPQLVTAVGMYREDAPGGTPKSLSGVGGSSSFYGGGYPTAVWTDYMRNALEGEPVEEFDQPVNGGTTVQTTKRPTSKPSSSATTTKRPSSSATPTAGASSTPTSKPSSSSTPTSTGTPIAGTEAPQP